MKEFIKKFADVSAAHNYTIAYIPFTTSVATNPIQNLVCNKTGKHLENNGGTVVILPPDSTNNEIHYTATSQVTPTNTSAFGTDVTYLPDESEYNATTHEGILKFDNDVTIIGNSAFSYCSDLTSITIPDSVTNIGNNAFSYCSSLTTVSIPNSVTSIGLGVFYDCSQLTTIIVDTNNQNYCSEDNVLFNKNKTTLVACPGGKQGVYSIPNTVTAIGISAFSVCSGLTSVTIPNGVTDIRNSAFSRCTGLTSITISNSVTNIANSAFQGCSGLTSIEIPNSVASIGENAFSTCTHLASVTLSNIITRIENSVFRSCSSLTYIEIPASVTSIGDNAFSSCTSLGAITCLATTPPILADYAFNNTNNFMIYVPNESVNAYKEAANWSTYADRIEPIGSIN